MAEPATPKTAQTSLTGIKSKSRRNDHKQTQVGISTKIRCLMENNCSTHKHGAVHIRPQKTRKNTLLKPRAMAQAKEMEVHVGGVKFTQLLINRTTARGDTGQKPRAVQET